MARNYIDNLREEVKKGMREKAEQGIYPSRPPLGYRNNKLERTISRSREGNACSTPLRTPTRRVGTPFRLCAKQLLLSLAVSTPKGHL